ncbi:MAG TPA: SRPBCC family protein [Candidatus Binatia bacterium]
MASLLGGKPREVGSEIVRTIGKSGAAQGALRAGEKLAERAQRSQRWLAATTRSLASQHPSTWLPARRASSTSSHDGGSALGHGLGLTAAFSLGAAAMYFFDAQHGRRRRARVRDGLHHSERKLVRVIDAARKDARNRAQGMVARARMVANASDSEAVSDATLAERVRSHLPYAAAHPGAIEVKVEDGVVVLRGPVLRDEVEGLLETVARVRGVRAVRNELEMHVAPDGISALQGEARRRRRVSFWQRHNWPPAVRVAGTAAGLLLIGAAARHGLRGALALVGGAGLLLRAATNKALAELTGIGAGRRAVDVQKTIHIKAPVEQVFRLWSDPTNLPRFLSHVRSVVPIEGGWLRWQVSGPAGIPLEWVTETTRNVENQLLAWQTIPGCVVEHAGEIRFEKIDGTTTMHVRMSYNPPGGALGHAVASLLGSNPKQAMDDDLVRFKSLLETGKTTVGGRAVRREELLAAE